MIWAIDLSMIFYAHHTLAIVMVVHKTI